MRCFGTSTGNFNTGVGAGALVLNNADSNTATGAAALLLNTSGRQNTAVGTDAMVFNDTGSNNTAVGAFALFNNIDSSRNNAFGVNALFAHQSGAFNNAVGASALNADASGSFNNAFGDSALLSNVSGIGNTAVGDLALIGSTGDYNTAWAQALAQTRVSAATIFISATWVSPAILMSFPSAGLPASGTDYDNTYIGGIYSTAVSDRIVYVGSDGHLGTLASSRRYKEEIKPMDKASEALFGLKPVTFRYKQQVDPSHKLSFGLIAEEVAKINPDLVSPDKQGKPQTVRYEAVNAMLLNEFLKEHATVQELKKEIAALTSTVKEQAAANPEGQRASADDQSSAASSEQSLTAGNQTVIFASYSVSGRQAQPETVVQFDVCFGPLTRPRPAIGTAASKINRNRAIHGHAGTRFFLPSEAKLLPNCNVGIAPNSDPE